ncbi:hypothetical protein T492DRAFT_1066719 [Pavlovales sp. CCMP2436]|nr:hypothetical protein T492DRAFT_1066719 [Pavlovales sp. CCMP2436]
MARVSELEAVSLSEIKVARISESEALSCFVCMEDGGAPLSNICGCTTSAIHRACLEKLVNSAGARGKPLEDRIRCAICTSPYTCGFTPYVIAPPRPGLFARLTKSKCLKRFSTPPCFGFLILVMVLVLNMLLGRQALTLYIFIAIAVLALLSFTISSRLRRRRGRPDPQVLDDNLYYDRVVAQARSEVARGFESPFAEARQHESKCVILLARPPRLPASASLTDSARLESPSLLPAQSPVRHLGNVSTAAPPPLPVVMAVLVAVPVAVAVIVVPAAPIEQSVSAAALARTPARTSRSRSQSPAHQTPTLLDRALSDEL